eukprot:2524867-Alexandrium_andersonii.AAC.1
MSASLVGSEMCIRDRVRSRGARRVHTGCSPGAHGSVRPPWSTSRVLTGAFCPSDAHTRRSPGVHGATAKTNPC